MEGDPNGAPGADDAVLATEVAGDAPSDNSQVNTRPVDVAGAPGAAQSDPSADTSGDGSGDEAAAEAAARAEAEDRADLETYPESVRDYLKGIPQEHRKTLHEHFGQRERERMLAEQERANRLEQARAEAEAKAQAVRETQGKFLGEAPIPLRAADGTTFDGPTYAELAQALETRRGRDNLYQKYGLDEDGAEAVKAEMDQRRAMLTSTASHLEDRVWSGMAVRFKAGLDAIPGVDADAIIAGASGPDEVVGRLARALDEKRTREIAALTRDFEGRITALTANTEGMKGRVVAAESRRLETGGRTGTPPHIWTRAELKDLDMGTWRANREEIERQDRAGLIK